jgi:predicted amino acid racemase
MIFTDWAGYTKNKIGKALWGTIMVQGSPVLEIALDKIRENSARVLQKCKEKNIDVVGVTKGFSAMHQIVSAMVAGGIQGLADARMENIIEMRKRHFTNPITLLRIPRLSHVNIVVRYADSSINSEITVMKALAEAAQKMGRVHQIILMVDLGDLREGVLKENVFSTVKQIIQIPGLELIGLGTNMGCFGGVLPSVNNLGILVRLRQAVQEYLGIGLNILSGGATSSLLLVENNTMPKGINQLRIGEGILLGTDTTNNRIIPWLHQDTFRLRAEVIEVKNKPSVPIGEIGQDAFGNIPEFEDKGIRKRAIVALGRQEVYVEGLIPLAKGQKVLGASSDHTIVDVTDSQYEINIGDEIVFGLNYAGLLSASDSRYVKKNFITGENYGS